MIHMRITISRMRMTILQALTTVTRTRGVRTQRAASSVSATLASGWWTACVEVREMTSLLFPLSLFQGNL